MTTLLLSALLLLTIVAAFAFGIAAGYWVICGVLNLFHPSRIQQQTIQRARPGAYGQWGLDRLREKSAALSSRTAFRPCGICCSVFMALTLSLARAA